MLSMSDEKETWEDTHGTVPQLEVTTLSGKFPTWIHSLVVKSSPISSTASRIAAALSSTSSGSRFPPGRATWPVQRSPTRDARLIKRASGSPFWTQSCAKNVSSRCGTEAETSEAERDEELGQWWYVGRTRRIKATEARFLDEGGLGTWGYGRWCKSDRTS